MREDFNPPEKLLANQNGRCFNMAAMASSENDLLGFVSLFLLNNNYLTTTVQRTKEQPETNQQQQEQIKRKHGVLNKLYNRIVPATRFSHD